MPSHCHLLTVNSIMPLNSLRAMLRPAVLLLVIHGGHLFAAQPNFVIMIADDMSWDDCGAYGHPTIKTPNIDRLAQEGMRFDRAFLTISSCSPSRASIITGRYPHRTNAEELHWPLPGRPNDIHGTTSQGWLLVRRGRKVASR